MWSQIFTFEPPKENPLLQEYLTVLPKVVSKNKICYFYLNTFIHLFLRYKINKLLIKKQPYILTNLEWEKNSLNIYNINKKIIQ